MKGREKKMFSPDLVRYIIDPDNITGKDTENRKVSVEKQIFRFSILDHEKVLSDYSFFNRVLHGFSKACGFLASHAGHFKECKATENLK
jgi:hypothetical protein